MKYFFVVAALLVVQIGLGAIAAHYDVDGSSFYGIPLASVLPYSIARTWHITTRSFLDCHVVACDWFVRCSRYQRC
jgi:nitric oxide reductase large subunit